MNKLTFHNEFSFELKDVTTNKTTKAHAYNLITTRGVTRARGGYNIAACIQLGSGNGVPAEADTKLFTYVNSISASLYSWTFDKETNVMKSIFRVVLDETTNNGVLFTEVGLADGSGNGYLCTHAMIVDEHGQPMSIQKTDTTILTVYATIYTHAEFGAYYHNPAYGIKGLVPYIVGGSSRESLYASFIENSAFVAGTFNNQVAGLSTEPTGSKYTIEALGAQFNDRLYKYIGLSRESGRYEYSPGILYRAGYYPGFDRTLRQDDIIGTGDGEKSRFWPTNLYPVLKNEKTVVKVDDTVQEATYDTFTSWDYTEPTSGVYFKMNGELYQSVYQTVDSYSVRCWLYKYAKADLNADKELVAYLPVYYIGVSYGSGQLVPTALTASNGKLVVGFTGHTSTQGTFEGTIDPVTKEVTIGKSLTNAPFTGAFPNNDGTVVCSTRAVIGVQNETHTLLASSNSGLTLVDDLLYNTYNGDIYKIETTAPGTTTIRKLVTKGISYPPGWATLKKVGERKYALVTVKVDTSAGKLLGNYLFPSSCPVTIIDMASEVVTNDTFKVVNKESCGWTNLDNYVGPLLHNYNQCQDLILDLENKEIFVYCCSRRASAEVRTMVELDNGTAVVSSSYGYGYILTKSEEFIRAIKLSSAPGIDAKVKLTGELDGFLKTSNYKISASVQLNINAQNS